MTLNPNRSRRFVAAARLVVAGSCCALFFACGGGGGESVSPPMQPTAVVAEGNDSSVDLSWAPVAGATQYTVHWIDTSSGTGTVEQITGIGATNYLHAGLVNLHTYRYSVVAVNVAGRSKNSLEVEAQPGPTPTPVDWAVVVTRAGNDEVHWQAATGADRYRVYYSWNPAALAGRRPSAQYIETSTGPVTRVPSAVVRPEYYRVIGLNGPRIGTGGFIAAATVFDVHALSIPYSTPALWDIDDDGCLDVIGGDGDCAGGFETYPLADRGLDYLFAPGRATRDSRFADFNGDGLVDVISNVYAPATDTASRAALHLNDGTGRFVIDPAFAALDIGGFGETILTADFDNDGDIDVFLPHYWHRTDGGRNWLLLNDGAAHFTDHTAAAGLGGFPTTHPNIPEAARALDFDEDGWVDIFLASRLMINNHDGSFTDRGPDYNFPVRFDEGASFVDVDLDGDFDLIHNDSFVTKLFRNLAGVFDSGVDLAGDVARSTFGYGLVTCDLNGDAFPDLMVPINQSSTSIGAPLLMLNVAGDFIASDLGSASEAYVDLLACADLDQNGRKDILARWGGYRSLVNRAASTPDIKVRLLGSAGQRNQQGRIVKLRPAGSPTRIITRAVDSGSGYMAQGGYDLSFAAPWPGDYEVSVRFAAGVVTTTARPGDQITVYEDGRVSIGAYR